MNKTEEVVVLTPEDCGAFIKFQLVCAIVIFLIGLGIGFVLGWVLK